jgi:hypothetical protein
MAWNHVIIDIGLQYDTHGAPFSDHRPADSGNIVQKNSRESVIGLTPSNIGQSRVGLQGIEPLYGDWSAVFQVETFFNPQSGEIADSLKSLAVNNGRTPSTQTTGLDGRSAGQILCPGLRQQFAWQYQDSAGVLDRRSLLGQSQSRLDSGLLRLFAKRVWHRHAGWVFNLSFQSM